MKKEKHQIKLTGMMTNGHPAKTQQANKVVIFIGKSPNGKIVWFNRNKEELSTTKGTYNIPFDKELNIWKGVVNGVEVHVTLKKIVGKLIYWA